MGFTLTRNTGNSQSQAIRTPEQELAAKLNHDRMNELSINPPIIYGSEKQINWAKSIASKFLFHAHAWQFSAADIDLVFADKGKYSQFWIDNRNPSGNSGEGKTRVAVEKLLEEIRADRAALAKNQQAITTMSPAQLAKKIGRL
jgi:hypothetical protein